MAYSCLKHICACACACVLRGNVEICPLLSFLRKKGDGGWGGERVLWDKKFNTYSSKLNLTMHYGRYIELKKFLY